MLTLLFITCMLSGDDCRPMVAARGFTTMDECMTASKDLFIAWNEEHFPNRVVQQFMCTDDPDFFMGGKEI